MTIEDYGGVYDLWINTPGMGLNAQDDSYQGILKYIKRNPSTCFVAEADGSIVGAILAGHDGRRGYICHTAVALAHRGRGIAKALLESALRALDAEGINKAACVVFKRNEQGNGFWESAGFHARTTWCIATS